MHLPIRSLVLGLLLVVFAPAPAAAEPVLLAEHCSFFACTYPGSHDPEIRFFLRFQNALHQEDATVVCDVGSAGLYAAGDTATHVFDVGTEPEWACAEDLLTNGVDDVVRVVVRFVDSPICAVGYYESQWVGMPDLEESDLEFIRLRFESLEVDSDSFRADYCWEFWGELGPVAALPSTWGALKARYDRSSD